MAAEAVGVDREAGRRLPHGVVGVVVRGQREVHADRELHVLVEQGGTRALDELVHLESAVARLHGHGDLDGVDVIGAHRAAGLQALGGHRVAVLDTGLGGLGELHREVGDHVGRRRERARDLDRDVVGGVVDDLDVPVGVLDGAVHAPQGVEELVVGGAAVEADVGLARTRPVELLTGGEDLVEDEGRDGAVRLDRPGGLDVVAHVVRAEEDGPGVGGLTDRDGVLSPLGQLGGTVELGGDTSGPRQVDVTLLTVEIELDRSLRGGRGHGQQEGEAALEVLETRTRKVRSLLVEGTGHRGVGRRALTDGPLDTALVPHRHGVGARGLAEGEDLGKPQGEGRSSRDGGQARGVPGPSDLHWLPLYELGVALAVTLLVGGDQLVDLDLDSRVVGRVGGGRGHQTRDHEPEDREKEEGKGPSRPPGAFRTHPRRNRRSHRFS